MGAGWIGVDLDGTLAVYEGWNRGVIGAPIAPMVDRVKSLLAAGIEVRIVTARVGHAGGYSAESGRSADAEFIAEQKAAISDWCLEHIGQRLPVQAHKDFQMVAMYDDRVVQVEANTGRVIGLDILQEIIPGIYTEGTSCG